MLVASNHVFLGMFSFFINFLTFQFMENPLILYLVLLFIVSGISNLMSISDELYPYFFRRKVEKMRSMKEEMDGNAFISGQTWHFSFVNIMI